MNEPTDLLRITTAAFTFGVKPATVRAHVKQGHLTNYGKGRTMLVSQAAVAQVLGTRPTMQNQLRHLEARITSIEHDIIALRQAQQQAIPTKPFSRNQIAQWLNLHGMSYHTVKNWRSLPHDKKAALGYTIRHLSTIGGLARGKHLHECTVDPACPCHEILPFLKKDPLEDHEMS